MRRLLPWLAISLGLTGYLGYRMSSADQRIFLPGPTTHGHYQIELKCSECHTAAFTDRAALQAACERCHAAELAAVVDSHPKKKFTDPRNLDRAKVLDARECVTCHGEHRPETVSTMGLSLPTDYCYHCHQDIADDRPSHRGLAFDSCAQGGCHNFHDNQALYEDFLGKHLKEPALLAQQQLPARAPGKASGRPALLASTLDAPAAQVARAPGFLETSHARAAVNCSDCHGRGDAFVEKPPISACKRCHEGPTQGFEASRHGMRLAAGLSPMTPGLARQPMKADAHGRELSCNSCHNSHRFDTREAAVSACEACHDDSHTRAYRSSKHFTAWKQDANGRSGASCATCHLPRLRDDHGQVTVSHNQNLNLRPNEKMIRSVCMNCHGLGFSLDALADAELVKRNFNGLPQRHVPSLDWVQQRLSKH